MKTFDQFSKQLSKSLLLSTCMAMSIQAFAETAENQQMIKTEQEQKVFFDQQHFVSLTFHDVRDDVLKVGDRDPYAISTQNLVQFFEWLKRSDWHPVSLKQIMQARQGGAALPKNAVLISFDDGALSHYRRVFPLAKEYKIPVVFALVTSWMNGNTKAIYEAYGQGNEMTWAQVREMQKSGWVEFASHSHDLHQGILANPQNNQQPAAITRQYLTTLKRYETQQEYEQRILQDLIKSREILSKEVGVAPLAIVWPYGAVNIETEKLAQQAGLPLSFSLGTDAVNSVQDGTFQRGLAVNNPNSEDLYEQMTDSIHYKAFPLYEPIRALSFDLGQFSTNYSQADQQLGQILDLTNALKSNALLLNVVEDQNQDGVYDAAYFPNRYLPVKADVLNRTVWQAKTRIFNKVYAQLPYALEQQQAQFSVHLATDLLKNNTGLDGIILKTDQALQCAFQSVMSASCIEQQKYLQQTLQQLKQNSIRYSNISNPFKLGLQVQLLALQKNKLIPFFNHFNDQVNLFNFELDSIRHPQDFKQFIQQVQSLSAEQKAKIMLTLVVDSAQTEKDWQHIQANFLTLQRMGIQKLAINHYNLNNAAKIQTYLYTPLSLNQSPLTYRNPFIYATQGKSP
ncbi:poly-beta-1,6-N-acetyl-D-glucosamine N-deacetylase PgaB [Acinetobacter sp. CFCC 10889]|uniref:poly-beta-1,6-N-acetyl-D-glucosamine N-deacetylase PgaB n=1 Tax=Acinetobacter sp. CFCC 10889 TaxID=1775557 RepID=UPI000DCFDADA|nr:poly-beta-1,6-N-acetyl-D-glucosamine N-deacetylase PgaB [Acinetobacter sp. CFCC 10889]